MDASRSELTESPVEPLMDAAGANNLLSLIGGGGVENLGGQGAALGEGEEEEVVININSDELELNQKAHEAFRDRRLAEAENLLSQLSSHRPEDPLVLNNLAIVRFVMKEGLKDCNALVQAMRKADGVLIKNAADDYLYDVEQQAAIAYNLALAYFLSLKFNAAHQILLKLSDKDLHLSNFTSSESRKLLVDTLTLKFNLSLILEQLDDSLALASLLEQIDPENPVRILEKGSALLLAKQFKAFKKDLKPSNGMSKKQLVLFEFLRAKLEYLRGNYKKSQKLMMNAGQGLMTLEEMPMEIISCYNNNSGCVNILLNRCDLAQTHFERAEEKNVEAFKDQTLRSKKEALHHRHKFQILFNQGLCQLHMGKAKEAFDFFNRALPAFEKTSKIWLHMAECCIVHQQEKEITSSTKVAFQGFTNTKLSVIGQGEHRKIILPSSSTRNGGGGGPVEDQEPEGMLEPNLSMSYARVCIENSLVLLKLEETRKRGLMIKPNGRTSQYRASIQLKYAYICLCLSDHYMALKAAQDVLCTPGLPSGYLTFARFYLAECYMFLDRISEAITTMNPQVATSVTFDSAGKKDDDSMNNNNNGRTSSDASILFGQKMTRDLFLYNSSVAYLIREDFDRAEKILNALSDVKSSDLKINIALAKVYLYLKRGNVVQSRKIIQENALLTNS